MRFILTVFTVICLLPIVPTSAQTSKGYIVKGSTYQQGIPQKFDDKVEFLRTIDGVPEVYSIDEVKEFGIGKSVYVAIEIENKKHYAERLVKGDVQLYHYHGNFFIEQKDSLVELTRRNYQDVISNTLSCDRNESSTVTLSKSSLKNFLKRLNQEGCTEKYFPFRKFGVLYGFNTMTLDFSMMENIRFSDKASFSTIGLYGEVPLYPKPSLSLVGELQILSHSVSLEKKYSTMSYSSDVDFKGAFVPLALKWSPFDTKVRPFFRLGPVVYVLHLSSKSGLIETNEVNPEEPLTTSLAPSTELLLGYHGGIGADILLFGRKSIHVETRYSKCYMGSRHPINMGFNGINFLVTFSL